MNEQSILKELLETTFSMGVETDWEDLRRYLKDPSFPDRESSFKAELADAISNHTISPEEFEKLTAIDQDEQEDVDAFLTDEIWKPLYGDEPIRTRY
jgi:hypothetical protein